MNEDQLRAAAENIVVSNYAAIDLPTREQKLWRAAAKICSIWLAEHPDDDGEAVTEEWLKKIGFENHAGRLTFNRLQFTFYNGWNSWWAFTDLCGATRLIDNVKNRGHVRRLCLALGISL